MCLPCGVQCVQRPDAVDLTCQPDAVVLPRHQTEPIWGRPGSFYLGVGSPPLIGLIVSMLLANYLGLPKPQCVSVSASFPRALRRASRYRRPWFEPFSSQLCLVSVLLFDAASPVFPTGETKLRFLLFSFPLTSLYAFRAECAASPLARARWPHQLRRLAKQAVVRLGGGGGR